MPDEPPRFKSQEFSKVFDEIRPADRKLFLNEFLLEYIDRGGVGAMPKADADALLIHLFLKYSGKPFDSFKLSRLFKIKESRVKSLIAVAGVKFETRTESEVWMEILGNWKHAQTEIESIEKGQVLFKLENPAHFPLIQREARAAGGTISYSTGSEAVTVSMATLFRLLDQVYRGVLAEHPGHRYLIENLLIKVRDEVIGTNELKKVRDDKEKKMKITQVISTASNLASIGKIVAAVFGLPIH